MTKEGPIISTGYLSGGDGDVSKVQSSTLDKSIAVTGSEIANEIADGLEADVASGVVELNTGTPSHILSLKKEETCNGELAEPIKKAGESNTQKKRDINLKRLSGIATQFLNPSHSQGDASKKKFSLKKRLSEGNLFKKIKKNIFSKGGKLIHETQDGACDEKQKVCENSVKEGVICASEEGEKAPEAHGAEGDSHAQQSDEMAGSAGHSYATSLNKALGRYYEWRGKGPDAAAACASPLRKEIDTTTAAPKGKKNDTTPKPPSREESKGGAHSSYISYEASLKKSLQHYYNKDTEGEKLKNNYNKSKEKGTDQTTAATADGNKLVDNYNKSLKKGIDCTTAANNDGEKLVESYNESLKKGIDCTTAAPDSGKSVENYNESLKKGIDCTTAAATEGERLVKNYNDSLKKGIDCTTAAVTEGERLVKNYNDSLKKGIDCTTAAATDGERLVKNYNDSLKKGIDCTTAAATDGERLVKNYNDSLKKSMCAYYEMSKPSQISGGDGTSGDTIFVSETSKLPPSSATNSQSSPKILSEEEQYEMEYGTSSGKGQKYVMPSERLQYDVEYGSDSKN